jgi:SAM-dependent methyltransferase
VRSVATIAQRSARTACPVCADGPVAGALVKDTVTFRRCATCGGAFSAAATNANLPAAAEELPAAYLRYLAGDPDDERNHAALLRGLRGRGANLTGPLLDVGCGGGTFVRHLRGQGIEAYGVEPAAAVFDRFLSGEPWAYRSIAEATAAIGRPCPVVFALDVLEHVEDPVAFLRDLHTATAPHGRVVVSTPDAGSLVARGLGRRWHHYNRFHLTLFTRTTLERAAAAAGLRVRDVRHPGRRRSAGYVAQYLFDFGLRRRAPRWVGGLDRFSVPVNLGDTMLAELEPAAPAPVTSDAARRRPGTTGS